MPWHIDHENPECNGWAVVKDADGEIEGCHETEADAKKQLAALYANEPTMNDASSDGELRQQPPPDGYRAISAAPIMRETATGRPRIVGHFARFGVFNEIDSATEGRFLERIERGAFKKTFAENRPKILFQHGKDPQIGDKPIAAPDILREDEVGPYFEDELLDGIPPLIVAGLRAGQYGLSYRFRVVREDWQPEPKKSDINPLGLPERTIREAKVFEYGPVTFPADAGASVMVRSLSDEMSEPNPEPVAPSLDAEAETPHLEPERRDEPVTIAAPKSKENTAVDYITRDEKIGRIEELRAEIERMAVAFPGVMPDADQALFDAACKEQDDLKRDVAAWDARQARIAANADDSRVVEVPAQAAPFNVVRTRPDPEISDIGEIRSRSRTEDEFRQGLRDNALRSVERATFPHPDADAGATRDSFARLLDYADSPDKELARRILTTGTPQYRKFFQHYLATGQAERAGQLLVQTDNQGGYAIPFYMDPTLVKTGAYTPINPYRQACTVKQIVGTDTYMGASAAAVTIARAAEAAASVEGGPAIGTISKVVSKVHAMVTLSIEMLEDRPEIIADMTSLISEAKDTEEENIFTLGDGAALGTSFQPTGMLAAHTVTAYCWTHRDTDVQFVLDADDLFKTEAALPIRHRPNAAWFMGRATIRAIQALETANGQLFGGIYGNVGQGPVNSPTGNTGLRLLQYPVYEVPSAVTGNAADAVVAGFGDPKGFYIIDRVGMSLEVIPHLWAAAMLPTGTRGIYAWWRNTSFAPNPDSGRRLAIHA